MKVKDIFGKIISTIPIQFLYKNMDLYNIKEFDNDESFILALAGTSYEEYNIHQIVSTAKALIIIADRDV